MIIPVRCMTCGKVIADKWRAYERLCGEDKGDDDAAAGDANARSKRAEILDRLKLTNGCCRTMMLTHVDLSLLV